MVEVVTINHNIGYILESDVYITFTEYYGDGTIYGRSSVLLPTGEPVTGPGKTKMDLIALGAVIADDKIGAATGDLLVVPTDAPVEPTPEAPVEPTPDASVEPTPDAPVEPTPDAPVEPTPEASILKIDPYAVQVTVGGFTVICRAQTARNIIVHVDSEAKIIQFAV